MDEIILQDLSSVSADVIKEYLVELPENDEGWTPEQLLTIQALFTDIILYDQNR
jgi:hypothetical protein